MGLQNDNQRLKSRTEALESGGRYQAGPYDPAPGDTSPADQSSRNKTSQETTEDDPVAQEEYISSFSSLQKRDVACRHMERCKSDWIVMFLNRQVRRTGNEIPEKNQAHLPFTQKKDVHPLFFREFAIRYPQESIVSTVDQSRKSLSVL